MERPEDFFEITNIIDAHVYGLFSDLSPKGDGKSLTGAPDKLACWGVNPREGI